MANRELNQEQPYSTKNPHWTEMSSKEAVDSLQDRSGASPEANEPPRKAGRKFGPGREYGMDAAEDLRSRMRMGGGYRAFNSPQSLGEENLLDNPEAFQSSDKTLNQNSTSKDETTESAEEREP